MRRVRVAVVFEEVDELGRVKETPQVFRFGSVTSEDFGPPERIARKVGESVENTILLHFPDYLAGRYLKP